LTFNSHIKEFIMNPFSLRSVRRSFRSVRLGTASVGLLFCFNALAQTANPTAPNTTTPSSPAPYVCSQCGVVSSVTKKSTKGKATWVGSVGGAVAGGVIGNQVGGGNGKVATTVVGATGGALVGREAEKRMKKKDVYEIVVQMEGGTSKVLIKEARPAIQPGDKVKVIGEDIFVR
jgi:outer membrane lipoprotein SlyB